MKIVALIEDGHGHRHLLGSRSPDLVRRELSARAGTAMLLWCAVPDRAPLRGVTEGGPARISGLAGLVSVRGLPAG